MTADDNGTLAYKTGLSNWIGTSKDKDPRVKDGALSKALLNEPNGCWASTSSTGEFKGLYIADTGNDCIRFAHPDGTVTTLDLKGVPDVRETATDCVGGKCVADFGFSDSDEEEKKEQ